MGKLRPTSAVFRLRTQPPYHLCVSSPSSPIITLTTAVFGYYSIRCTLRTDSQPYTRQHDRQREDLTDQRAKSFLHLCDMLRVMDDDTLPKIIVLENVIGFESVS